MHIETVDRNDYRVFRIHDTITIASNISELRALVEESLRQGRRNVGVCFTEKSHLYTRHISILAQCLTKLRAGGGTLALVNPNDAILEALKAVGLSGLTMLYTSEDEMCGKREQG